MYVSMYVLYVCKHSCNVCMFLCTVRNVCMHMYVHMFVICVPVHVYIYGKNLHFTTVFLRMNPCVLKHAEDVKN